VNHEAKTGESSAFITAWKSFAGSHLYQGASDCGCRLRLDRILYRRQPRLQLGSLERHIGPDQRRRHRFLQQGRSFQFDRRRGSVHWQVQNWVWGLEADIQGSREKGTRNFICPIGVCTPAIIGALPIPGPAVPVSLTEKLLWFGTVRGRVGVLATPVVLFYATGGLAYGEVAFNISVGPLNSFSPNNTKVGYSVGAGVEGMFARNWTARLEYLYVDLGSVSGSLVTTVPARRHPCQHLQLARDRQHPSPRRELQVRRSRYRGVLNFATPPEKLAGSDAGLLFVTRHQGRGVAA
jgi:opacity protein-like surface antigen